MKKSLNDLIENSYVLSPDADEESEAVGALITSYNKPKGYYVSRYIQENELQNETKRKHILRVMLREIIIQYGDILDTENIEQIISSSSKLMLDVENFIEEKVSKVPRIK